MFAFIFAVFFGLSLLPGKKPLCLRFAERISDGILPLGAELYCRRLTFIWFFILILISLINLATFLFLKDCDFILRCLIVFLSCLIIPLTFLIEGIIRRKRFQVVFHTSGSTGKSKTITKTFESLAREVAFHRAWYLKEFPKVDFTRVKFLATIDPSHMYGKLWRDLLPKALKAFCDAEIILTPESLTDKMRQAEKVFLLTTPSFLDRLTSYASQYEVPKNAIEIITSGALLSKKTSDQTEKVFGLSPRQIFGSTETGGVAWRRGDGDWNVFSSVNVKESDGRLAVKSRYSFTRAWYLMGDAVKLSTDKQTFVLFGRADRLVKINEERVNLSEMENRIRELGFHDCALVAMNGERGAFLGAVIAVGPNEKTIKNDALFLRQKLLPIFPKGTVPRRFRVVRELPRNSQGKVLREDVLRLLESALTSPTITDINFSTDHFSANLVFSPDAQYCKGHFPDLPVLPGVVQLGFAVRWAEEMMGSMRKLQSIKKMKFMHVIQPGQCVRINIARTKENEFSYFFNLEDKLCSSGVLVF